MVTPSLPWGACSRLFLQWRNFSWCPTCSPLLSQSCTVLTPLASTQMRNWSAKLQCPRASGPPGRSSEQTKPIFLYPGCAASSQLENPPWAICPIHVLVPDAVDRHSLTETLRRSQSKPVHKYFLLLLLRRDLQLFVSFVAFNLFQRRHSMSPLAGIIYHTIKWRKKYLVSALGAQSPFKKHCKEPITVITDELVSLGCEWFVCNWQGAASQMQKKAIRPINGTRVPEENMLSNKAGHFFSLLVSLYKPNLFGNENNIKKWSSAGWEQLFNNRSFSLTSPLWWSFFQSWTLNHFN